MHLNMFGGVLRSVNADPLFSEPLDIYITRPLPCHNTTNSTDYIETPLQLHTHKFKSLFDLLVIKSFSVTVS